MVEDAVFVYANDDEKLLATVGEIIKAMTMAGATVKKSLFQGAVPGMVVNGAKIFENVGLADSIVKMAEQFKVPIPQSYVAGEPTLTHLELMHIINDTLDVLMIVERQAYKKVTKH